MVILMTVWLTLATATAYASEALHLPLAIPVANRDDRITRIGLVLVKRVGPSEPQPGSLAELYLPDLRTLPLSDLKIQILDGGRRSLRLANTIWNSGRGPLELTGEFNAALERRRVYQMVDGANGERYEHLVGEFVWHPTHEHWHFDDFTLYELWTLTPDHNLDEVVASSDKLSYCVMDTDVVDRDRPYFALRRGFASCNQRKQGLSVGWGDTYKSFLDGQALDLTGIPNGLYALTSSVNPNGVILEENLNNNSTRVYVEILGERLTVVTLKQIRAFERDQTLRE
jgi:hypothetical protein